MNRPLKLMCVLAHPDDESMGTGGILAKYAEEGVETYLVTATRGERGWFGDESEYPGPQALGLIRQNELCEAAAKLGLQEVSFLDYCDGELENADMDEVVSKIAYHLRRVQPDVVVTFDQNGAYGHPDHIAICQFTTAAVMAAADPTFGGTNGWRPHRVSKLYYMVWNDKKRAAFESGFGELVMQINGEPRGSVTWEDWAITTRVDASEYSDQVWDAITSHRTQLPAYNILKDLPSETHIEMWGNQMYYRAFSLVNSGPKEQDLFAGLR